MFLEYLKHNLLYKVTIFSLIIILSVSCETPVEEEEKEDDEKQKPVAEFKITFEGANQGVFDPIIVNPAETGSNNVNIKMIPAGINNFVSYERYRIDFTGDVGKLPDTVGVKIIWTMQEAISFYWGSDASHSGTLTVNVPRGGGTIGVDGTIINTSGNVRPYVRSDNSTAGTVKFEADNVYTLTCTVVR